MSQQCPPLDCEKLRIEHELLKPPPATLVKIKFNTGFHEKSRLSTHATRAPLLLSMQESSTMDKVNELVRISDSRPRPCIPWSGRRSRD